MHIARSCYLRSMEAIKRSSFCSGCLSLLYSLFCIVFHRTATSLAFDFRLHKCFSLQLHEQIVICFSSLNLSFPLSLNLCPFFKMTYYFLNVSFWCKHKTCYVIIPHLILPLPRSCIFSCQQHVFTLLRHTIDLRLRSNRLLCFPVISKVIL